jgi:tetratricopeptide (TPR) repeat protein
MNSAGRSPDDMTPIELRALVQAAADELPPRSRAIIARCDLAGELHATVARDLGISERHFYRERREALALLSATFKPNADVAAAPSEATDPDDLTLAAAQSLSSAGKHQEAIAFLENVLQRSSAECFPISVALKLGQLYCDNGRLDKASHLLALSEQALGHSATASSSEARIDAVRLQASLLLYGGRGDSAKRLLARGIDQFNLSCSREQQVRRARALAGAQLDLSDILISQDQYSAALPIALEADSTARRLQLDAALRCRALIQLAFLRLINGSPARFVMADLQNAFYLAQSNTFIQDCVQITLLLSEIHSRAGHHTVALSFAHSAVSVTRALGLSTNVPNALYTLAYAELAKGDLTNAAVALEDLLAAHSSDPTFAFADPKIVEAGLLHAQRHYAEAIAAAAVAATNMTTVHSNRGLGAALLVKAEIEYDMGEWRRARISVDHALGLLSLGAPPHNRARAYNLSARLTRNRRHEGLARELAELASLRS